MYRAFYGLTEKPFNLTPDPRFLYLSEKHKEAFAHLVYGIKNRSGFVMISGEVGAGKTTICRGLLSQLDQDVELAIVFNPCLSPEELLRTINEDFGIASTALTIKGLIDELNGFLLDRYAQGKNCVLVIDESQNLAPSVLEQIRMLSNLETETQKLLQIILIGQPELAQHLQLPELRQLNQRITARYHLRPLNQAETLEYIVCRLRIAGGRRRLRFTRGAVRKVFQISGGTPRVINALCDRALLVGFTKETRNITTKLVKQAHKELVGETFKPKRSWRALLRPFLPSPAIVPTVAVIFLAFLLARWYFMPYYVRWEDFPTLASRTASAPNASSPEAAKVNGMPSADTEIAQAQTTDPAKENAPPAPEYPAAVVASVAPEQKPAALPPTPTAPAADRLLADRIAAADPMATLKAATAGIFRCWNMALVAGYPKDTSADSIDAFVRANGMSAESLEPALDQLISLNLPALVLVKSGGDPVWVGVTGVENGKLRIIADASGPFLVPRDEFREVYENRALVFWQEPAPDARAPAAHTLYSGVSGPEVAKFQKELKQLARFQGKTSGVYGEETTRAVARIQAETGMAVDGIAGKQVRMVLTAWTPGSGVPTLQARATPTPVAVDSAPVEKKEPAPKEAPASPPDLKPALEPAKEESVPGPAETKAETPKVEAPAAPAPAETKDEPPNPAAPEPPAAPAPQPPPATPGDSASAEPARKDNPLPVAVGPSSVTSAPGYAVKKPDLDVQELPPSHKSDSLAPLNSDDSKEVTPPLTGNTPLVPRQPSGDQG